VVQCGYRVERLDPGCFLSYGDALVFAVGCMYEPRCGTATEIVNNIGTAFVVCAPAAARR
jgi:hypothetical protein